MVILCKKNGKLLVKMNEEIEKTTVFYDGKPSFIIKDNAYQLIVRRKENSLECEYVTTGLTPLYHDKLTVKRIVFDDSVFEDVEIFRQSSKSETEKCLLLGCGRYLNTKSEILAPLCEEEGYITIGDWYLYNKFGKYQPNLSILSPSKTVKQHFQESSWKNFNLPDRRIEILYGDFFVSKKGANCFRILPENNAKHILIKNNWGGAFSKGDRGAHIPTEQVLYKRITSSNGGGCGVNWYVVPKEWKFVLSEDEI